MLNRKITNIIRYFLDNFLPVIIRDNRYIIYPLFYIFFKGKNIKQYMDFKLQIHSMSNKKFKNIYENYDSLPNRKTDLNKKSINYICNNLDGNHNSKIVEIGCGNGYLLNIIVSLGYNDITGCDIVDQKLGKNIKFVKGNIEKLPFRDNEFDIVLCNHTLEHVLNLDKAVKELLRITRKKIIITVPRQRYYKYTFDLHIHFFPEKSYLIKAIGLDKYDCVNNNGDWSYVGYL